MGNSSGKSSDCASAQRGNRSACLHPYPTLSADAASSPYPKQRQSLTCSPSLTKRNPLESPEESPLLATALTPPVMELSASISRPRLAFPSRGPVSDTNAFTPPQPPAIPVTLPESPCVTILRCDATRANHSAGVGASGGGFGSGMGFAGRPPTHRSTLASPQCSPMTSPANLQDGTGFVSLATGTSPKGFKHRSPYLGEEMELLEEDSANGDALDDFALASTHSAKHALRRSGLPESPGGVSEEAMLSLSGCQRIPVPISARTAGIGAVRSPLRSASHTRGSPRREVAHEEVLQFVSLRRPGVGECRMCSFELAHGSNYCSQCGSPTEALLTPTDQSIMGVPTIRLSNGIPSGLCVTSHTLTASSCAAAELPTPNVGAGDLAVAEEDASARHRLTLSPASETSLSARHVPAPRRKVYRRRVRIVGRYEKKALLGTGASGAVFRAVDILSGQHLAVKQIIVDPKDDFEIASIRNELRHLSCLRHRNIIEYLGCSIERVQSRDMISLIMDEEMGAPLPGAHSLCAGPAECDEGNLRVCILMERMECGTLEHLLEEFPNGMPESAVRNYLTQLLDAVTYLHRCGLTHRDIKPSNILLSSDCLIKLSDFGCAVFSATCGAGGAGGARVSADTPASVQKIAGTPAYMPPEALSAAGKTDAELARLAIAQDTWAVGCVAHQMLTGQVPWSHVEVSNQFALLLHVQNAADSDEAFPISPLLSPMARDFCRLCFQREPLRRTPVSELLYHPFIIGNLSGSDESL